MSEQDNDYLYRFVFEQFGVRGEFVRMNASWQAVRERHSYSPMIEQVLGRALSSVLLLSGTIKFKGSLGLQVQSQGALRSLIAQATEQRTVRGMATVDAEQMRQADAQTLLNDARLVLTAESPSGERYQGIVGVEGGDMAGAVETYFSQSEQLPTRLWLAVDEQASSGLFLQRLPGEDGEQEDEHWNRVCLLADTLKDEELLQLSAQELLHRLFHEEDVRLFDPEPVAFRCGCSRERVGNALVALGEGEVAQMLEELEVIDVNCEFCNANYRFDTIDAAALFTAQPSGEPPQGLQ